MKKFNFKTKNGKWHIKLCKNDEEVANFINYVETSNDVVVFFRI